MRRQIVVNVKFDDWLDTELCDLRCEQETKAYVIGVLLRPQEIDMSKQSVVLAYQHALECGEFTAYQRIGDWSLWSNSIAAPGDIGQSDLLHVLGSMSYAACHRLLNRRWKLYEELADDLPTITCMVRNRLSLRANSSANRL